MISEAAIMPSLAAAVFRAGDELRAVRLGSGGTGEDCTRQIGMLLMHGVGRTLAVTDVSEEAELLNRLRLATASQRALTFVLAGADSELSADNRQGSLVCAEELVSDDSVLRFARHRLLGFPPPPEADFAGARDLARTNDCTRCKALYEDVLRFGPVIQPVLQALSELLCLDHIGEYDPDAVLHSLIDNGVVAEAVHAFGSHHRQQVNMLSVKFGQLSVLRSQVPRLPHVLAELSNKLVQNFPTETVHGIAPQEERARPQDPWLVAIEEWLEELRTKKSRSGVPTWSGTTRILRRKGREPERLRSPSDADAKLTKVEKQVDYITRLLKGGSESLENAVLDLIAYQKRNSQPEHLCKTLSLLGHRAMEQGEFDLAFRFYGAAQLANETDPAAYCGYAETLRNMGRLEEALAAYTEAKERFPNDGVSFCGHAETLRSMGRLGEALAAYTEAKDLFPTSPVPFCGYAETLRELGRLDEALRNYQELSQRFTWSRVVNTSLACLLIETGNLQRARELLSTSFPCSRDDWWDFHVAAMMELWSGDLEHARSQLELGAHECPFFKESLVFKCTLAALNLRERRKQAMISIVDPGKIVPFPAALVVYVHLAAENKQIAQAEMGLRSILIAKFKPATTHLKRLYGLAGEPRVALWQEEEEREALWIEERKLLLRAAKLHLILA
jgi:tetratricopeptide (TPR) repeat protein